MGAGRSVRTGKGSPTNQLFVRSVRDVCAQEVSILRISGPLTQKVQPLYYMYLVDYIRDSLSSTFYLYTNENKPHSERSRYFVLITDVGSQ